MNESNPISIKKAASVVTSLLAILLVSNIILAAQLSHTGLFIKEQEQIAKKLSQEIITLEQSIYQQASLHELEKEALELGYTKEIVTTTLIPDTSVAQVYP